MRRPRFVAEQARNAQGPLGRLVAFIMARETRGVNQRVIEALGINRIDHRPRPRMRARAQPDRNWPIALRLDMLLALTLPS